MLDLEGKLAHTSAKLKKMQIDFAKTGRRNPNYSALITEKEQLAKQRRDMQATMVKLKQDRRVASAERSTRAPETPGDTFMRVARMMLADDVYEKIAQTAGEEWQRLYGSNDDVVLQSLRD